MSICVCGGGCEWVWRKGEGENAGEKEWETDYKYRNSKWFTDVSFIILILIASSQYIWYVQWWK